MLWTLIFSNVTSYELDSTNTTHLVPIQSIILSNSRIECPEVCSKAYCLKHISPNSNCTKFIRDQCDCCHVCLRDENDICGGRFNVHGICADDLLCYQSNRNEHKGICVKGKKHMTTIQCDECSRFLACWKYQCLSIVKDNKTTCECANRSVPCDKNLYFRMQDNCENRSILREKISPTFLKTSDGRSSSYEYIFELNLSLFFF